MPYNAISDLPSQTKDLPTHAKEIYMKAFNSAFVTYDGDENKSHATAWAAVELKYKKVDGEWVAKTAEAEGMSDYDKRDALQTALTKAYKLDKDDPIPQGAWIEEVYEDSVVYQVNGQSYKASYTMDEDGKMTLGEPEKVVKKTTYNPVESLQAAYAEVIQEAGKRNAVMDAGRIKKIVSLCQELLSSEVGEEEIKKAVAEAKSVVEWLKTQETSLGIDGTSYPATAFAYTPDLNDPSTWSLRMQEGDKVILALLNEASASISPGGLRGHKVTIPEANRYAVKSHLRAAYRTLGIAEGDISKWAKETSTRERVFNYIPLTEAKIEKGRATVIVIKPGFNTSEDRYYPAEMLKRDYKVFEGQKMYADHPTEQEDKDLPERSIKTGSWVAVLKDVTVDESGVVTGVAEIIEEWLKEKLSTLQKKGLLSEMGISINAVGNASKGKIDGKETLVIEELTGARSVDFVTEPGAGGAVTLYESDRGYDIDLVELSVLKERRPDLVKIIEADNRAKVMLEVKAVSELEDRVKELEGQNATLTTDNTTLTTEKSELQTKIDEADKAKAKAEAQATIKEAVDKAELPEAAKKRLTERFESADTADGITEAIQAESDYIKELTEAKVVNLGPSHEKKEEEVTKALRESFKKLNPDWTDEQLEVAVTGR